MLAEMLIRGGTKLLEDTAPEGRSYWAARLWDREAAEKNPVIGPHYRDQKQIITGMFDRYGAEAHRVLEFACGTGEFTVMAAERTPAKEIVAMDISGPGLEVARTRVPADRVTFVQGDFWADHDLGAADVVVCLDAIHHLGDVRSVLERLVTFVRPGGVLIGNLWTADHFADLQRHKYGTALRLARSALFFVTAVTIRATGGAVRTSSYRTQLLRTRNVEPLLRSAVGEVVEVVPQRYFVAFVCRP